MPWIFHYFNDVIFTAFSWTYLKGLLIHTSKGCTLDVHPVGTCTTPVWSNNIAAGTSSVKWALNASITIKDFWKPIFLFFAHVSQPYIFISYHHHMFIHPNIFLGDNTGYQVIKDSKIFNSAVRFTREDDRWW